MEYFIIFHDGVWNDITYEGGRKEYIHIPAGGITFEELLCMIEVRMKKNRSTHVFEIDSLVHVCPGECGRMKITNKFEWSCVLGIGKLPTVYVSFDEISKELSHPGIIRLNSVGSANSMNEVAVAIETSMVPTQNTSNGSTSKNSQDRMQCEELVTIEESIPFDVIGIPSDPFPVGYIGESSTFLDNGFMILTVCLYHMKHFAEFFTKRSEKKRNHLVCKFAQTCKFLLRARAFGISWIIKEFHPHTCVVDLRNSAAPKVTNNLALM